MSYSASSGPKQAGQTYSSTAGRAVPQLRQRRPTMRVAGSVGADGVSIAMVVLRETAGSVSGPGMRAIALDGRGVSEGEFPYRAGGPARTWHLADSSVGCRGFIGPVPLPLLIRALRLCRDATGASTQRQRGRTGRWGPQPFRNVLGFWDTTAEADSCGPFTRHASRAAGRSDRDRLRTGSRTEWQPPPRPRGPSWVAPSDPTCRPLRCTSVRSGTEKG